MAPGIGAPRGLRGLDFQGNGDRIQNRKSCLVLVGQITREQLEAINGAIEQLLSVWYGQKLQDQSSLE